MGALILSALNVYPVKSAGGVALLSARVDERGLAGDRRWMVVDSDGRFLTQRTHPRLALVSVAIRTDQLTLGAPSMAPLALRTPPPTAPVVAVRVWEDICEAVTAEEDASRWLSEFLGIRCRLVLMADASHRLVGARGGAPASRIAFADAFPFLLISEESLEDLNSRLATPLPMDRFRPNLVVRGCEPYAEDGWRRIRIGGIIFWVVKPCSRCTTTTVDQSTGERGREPLATLATYRRAGNNVLFGQNLVHEGTGELRFGDGVAVLERA
jgi:uncharacterized protein YcbX